VDGGFGGAITARQSSPCVFCQASYVILSEKVNVVG
jgi:hypothetical protein